MLYHMSGFDFWIKPQRIIYFSLVKPIWSWKLQKIVILCCNHHTFMLLRINLCLSPASNMYFEDHVTLYMWMNEWMNGCEKEVNSKDAQSQLLLDFITLDKDMSQSVSWNTQPMVNYTMNQKHNQQH